MADQQFEENTDLDARIFLAAKNKGTEGLKELVEKTEELNGPVDLNKRVDWFAAQSHEYREKVFDRAYEIEQSIKN